MLKILLAIWITHKYHTSGKSRFMYFGSNPEKFKEAYFTVLGDWHTLSFRFGGLLEVITHNSLADDPEWEPDEFEFDPNFDQIVEVG